MNYVFLTLVLIVVITLSIYVAIAELPTLKERMFSTKREKKGRESEEESNEIEGCWFCDYHMYDYALKVKEEGVLKPKLYLKYKINSYTNQKEDIRIFCFFDGKEGVYREPYSSCSFSDKFFASVFEAEKECKKLKREFNVRLGSLNGDEKTLYID